MSLAGVWSFDLTRSGTLIARPGQNVLFSKPQDYTIGFRNENLLSAPICKLAEEAKA